MNMPDTTSLRALSPSCFEGVIPAALGTCAADGTPNATWLSQVFLVDDHHVALSCQFFRKTRANLDAHPVAQLLVVDPGDFTQWILDLRFVRSETEGPTFDKMKHRIEAIASASKMDHVFALKSADVFEVIGVNLVPREGESRAPSPRITPNSLAGLVRLTEGIAAASELAAVVETGLNVLGTHLAYESVSLYLLEESEGHLYALASRGFQSSGVGARIPLGVSVIGTCAQRRMPVRIADAARELLYRRAVEEQVERVRGQDEREIPLPGLDGARSLLAVPLVLHGRLFGVLTTESRRALAFDDRDVEVLITAGHLLAQAIALHRDTRDEDADRDADDAPPKSEGSFAPIKIRYYPADDSVLIDGDYLIKGLPGRILFRVLSLRQAEGRSTFLNRELRLDPFLRLPAFKDNLETRLLMLQRRLEEKGSTIRLSREQRGRLHVVCEGDVVLETVNA
ncbi:Adenylate cyclase [Labilithrix luteola]|uniref:Adenylate cyclase n=1 Tax=Labilithrix luteola TaxID=1391654 RepID=A0A0K1Q1S9_9BACT|nr:GAF domain-containing protein [Labilithrix luteola]AKU99606.1 Adenylate cyclase [Labilithrix luteola]